MKITGIICCLALLCTACSEEKTELPWGSDNYIVSFSLTTGADTYPAVIRDGRITVSIPYNVSLEDAQVSYELCEHASIYPDPATVADWDQEWQFLVSSYDNQNDRTYLYTVERTDIATDGSLTLRTQAEVDAFARSGINTVEGNLTIGGEDEENPVTNLDGLKNLVSVRCDLTITAAYTGETLAGLENLTACESLRIGSAAHPNETLRQLSLPALKEIKGDLCVYGTALQTADFKSLQSVAGHFVLQSDALLQLTADELTTVAGNMTLIGTTADEAKAPCEQMYFPKLQRIDGTLTLSRFDRLSGLGTTFGVLTQAGALRYEHLALANTFEFPLIETTGNITVTDCPICDRSCCRHSPTPDRSKLRGVRPSKHYPSRKRSVSTATLAWQRSPRSRISGNSFRRSKPFQATCRSTTCRRSKAYWISRDALFLRTVRSTCVWSPRRD